MTRVLLPVKITVGLLTLLFPLSTALAQQTPTTAVAPPTSLTLAAATALALGANPTARAANYPVLQAQARLAQAIAQQRWQILFSSAARVSSARSLQPPPLNETFGEWVNTLSIPLNIGRRARFAIAQANAEVATAQAQYDAARLTLAGQVSNAYYDLLRKQALLKVAQEAQRTAEQQLTQSEKRFKAGDVAELDVLRAKVPVINAQSAILQAENAVTVAQQTLNGLLGQSLDLPVAVADVEATATPTTLPMTLEEARATAKKNSPDVRAAMATVRASEQGLLSARQSREPTYSLQASDTRSNDQTSFSRLDSLQATVTIPLSDSGLSKAQIREADAALALAKAQQRVAEQNLDIAVSTAYRNAESSLRIIETARQAQGIAQTSFDKATRGYEAGLFPLTDVLNARTELTQARIAYTQALYDAAAARATLDNALGVLPR